MKTNNLIGEKDNREVMEVGNLKVSKNAIYFDNSILQISNINHIYIKKFRKDPFPLWTLVGILIGLLTLWFLVGIVIIAVSIYFIYKYYKENKNDKFGLHIQMSSGFCMIIGSEDYQFLYDVQEIIAKNFIENNSQPTTINLDNKNIVIEKNEGIVNTGNQANNAYIHNV